jgi:hypothetical protein
MLTKKCSHYWQLPEPVKDNRSTVTGQCKLCGAKKRFLKSFTLTHKEYMFRLKKSVFASRAPV